jgi:hypothetical protein
LIVVERSRISLTLMQATPAHGAIGIKSVFTKDAQANIDPITSINDDEASANSKVPAERRVVRCGALRGVGCNVMRKRHHGVFSNVGPDRSAPVACRYAALLSDVLTAISA